MKEIDMPAADEIKGGAGAPPLQELPLAEPLPAAEIEIDYNPTREPQ